ncbi:hypothetical protein CC78DRAFT_612565 [Lojkania enalia]|uniref:BTB domain-containing protein n=1 Tax=Lojkania enalia TaxID=147567 RepID=A0A9P4N9I3_9PLEO|nr:hypothetical protein CC78DRAFT_612565 [Didymosphaeria enalia]
MSASDFPDHILLGRRNENSYPSVYGQGGLAVNSYKKSPYTDENIIFLDVGLSQTRFCIHRILLSQSAVLDAKPFPVLWGETNETISLPEMNDTTAHTLIHYLYTGIYQTLYIPEPGSEGAISEHKLGTGVYCAACRYKLPGLAELAKEKIKTSGEDLSVVEVLGIARETAYPGLPEDDEWYPSYLEDRIRAAGADDPELFTKADFVDQLEGDRKYRQVVMRAVVGSYSRAPNPLNAQGTSSSTPKTLVEDLHEHIVPGLSDTTQDGIAREAIKVPNAVIENKVNEVDPDEKSDKVKDTAQEECLVFEAIEPAEESVAESAPQMPAQPEPATDELGWQNSKTYQKYGKKTDSILVPDAVADEKTHRPVHFRSDSVIQVTESVAEASLLTEEKNLNSLGSPEDMAPNVEEASNKGTNSTIKAEEPATNGPTTISKKKSKKGKKKNAITVNASATV